MTSRLDFIIGDFATLTSRQLRRGALDVVRVGDLLTSCHGCCVE